MGYLSQSDVYYIESQKSESASTRYFQFERVNLLTKINLLARYFFNVAIIFEHQPGVIWLVDLFIKSFILFFIEKVKFAQNPRFGQMHQNETLVAGRQKGALLLSVADNLTG